MLVSIIKAGLPGFVPALRVQCDSGYSRTEVPGLSPNLVYVFLIRLVCESLHILYQRVLEGVCETETGKEFVKGQISAESACLLHFNVFDGGVE